MVYMADRLASARDAGRRVSDETVDATVREQLRSIDEGLRELTEDEGQVVGGPGTEGDEPHGDGLEGKEAELADPASEADGPARGPVEAARDAVDGYRRAYTRD